MTIRSGAMSNRQFAVIIIGVLMVMYLPFVNKPLHIDDTNLLAMSGAVKLPFGTVPDVKGYALGMPMIMSPFATVHPLMAYFLRLVSAISGSDAEYVYHLSLLIFPLLLIAGIRGTCGELNLPFVPAVLMVEGSLAFLPLSHTLMADAPALSLWVLAYYFFIRGTRSGSSALLAGSSAVTLAAAGLSYQSVFFIMVLFMYLVFFHRDRWLWMAFFLVPLFLLAGLAVYLGGSHISWAGIFRESMIGFREGGLGKKVLGIVTDIGAITLFINPLFWVDNNPEQRRQVLYKAAFSAAAAFIVVLFVPYPFAERLWLIALVYSGIFFLLTATLAAARFREGSNRTLILLVVWFYMVIMYNLLVMPFAALRYLLPVLFPSVMLALLMLRRVKYLYLSAVFTAVLGMAVAYGDYIFASSQRDLPLEITKWTTGDTSRVWYVGDWGLQYYMRKQGFRYLTLDTNEPREGDLVFMSSVQRIWEPSAELFPRMKLVDELPYNSRYPIRVMGMHIHAGYYSHLWGYLPFTVSDDFVERLGVFRVIK